METSQFYVTVTLILAGIGSFTIGLIIGGLITLKVLLKIGRDEIERKRLGE